MDFYDVNCVICNSTISRYSIGSTDPHDLLQRQIRVDRKRLALQARDDALSDYEESDHEDSDRFHPENQSYNPTLVTDEGLKWLKRVRGLGFNYDASGTCRAFLSGPAAYVDGGYLEIMEADEFHNSRPGRRYQCFNEMFPFHESCYKLLACVITGSSDIRNLDKDALFKALGELMRDQRQNIDYGGVVMHGIFWWCEPGEEFCVMNPIANDLDVKGFMTSILDSNTFRASSVGVNLAKTISDPFGRLSYDLLHQITSYLPADSLLAFIEASAVINRATCANGFWQIALKQRTPWFWELHELLQGHLYPEVNFRRLFLWTMKYTIAKFGMTDPLMVVANRRRIWNVCQAIHDEYILWTNGRGFSESDESAKWIWRNAQAGPLYTVAHPQEAGSLIKKQWIYHADEFHKYPALFECFWNSNHELIGLSLSFGESRRIFGGPNIDQQVSDAICTSRAIPPSDWIDGLCLYIPGINPLGQDEHTAVRGITPLMFKRPEPAGHHFDKQMGQTEGNYRPLLSPGHPLVGLTGSVNKNGVICSLGILSCLPEPYNRDYKCEPTTKPDFSTIPQFQRLLWRPNNIPIRGREAERGVTSSSPRRRVYATRHDSPIWAHPRFTVLPFPELGSQDCSIPNDMIPHEAMIWAKNGDELGQLSRISACINGREGRASASNATGAILGLRVHVTGRDVDPIGYVKSIHDEDGEPDCHMLHFDIDGPGGEIITEIAVSTVSHGKAIRLRTNWDRAVCFGEETAEDAWDVQKPPANRPPGISTAGTSIAGIAMWFATPTAWDDKVQNYRFLGMTSAAAITMSGGCFSRRI